jgi:excisionase family DNA binding protein
VAPPSPRQRKRIAPPTLALSPEAAAESLGVSRDHFDKHILPELRVTRPGRRILIPVVELERWLERTAALTLAG